MAASCSPAYCIALVQRLRGGGGGGGGTAAQADAAARLAALVSGNTAAADMAAAAGAIPSLVQALRHSGSARLQCEAAKALNGICLNRPAHLRQLQQAGGIDALLPLLELLEGGLAASLVGSLAKEVPEMKQQLGATTLGPLLACVRTNANDNPRELALMALSNL